MFDDSRLRNLSSVFPQHIFQKLPTLRPHSKPLLKKNSQIKEVFNEFTPLNQINFRQPPLFPLPMTQRNYNRSKVEKNKGRSVSFIDFSEALTTVARISKLEEQYANCNNGTILRKLMQTSRVPRNLEKKEDNNNKNKRIAAESLSLNKKKPVNIFNYPDLGRSNKMSLQPQQKQKKPTFLADDYYEKPSMLRRDTPNKNNNRNIIDYNDKNYHYGTCLKKHDISIEKYNLEKKEVFQNVNKNMSNNHIENKKDVVNVRVKTASFHKEQRKEEKKLFSRVRDKISNKKLVTLGEETEIIEKCTKKPENSPKILFEDTKVGIEPWKIQDSFSEEMS